MINIYVKSDYRIVVIDDIYQDTIKKLLDRGHQPFLVYTEKSQFVYNLPEIKTTDKLLEDLILPYRTVDALVMHSSLSNFSRQKTLRFLNIWYDWMTPRGVILCSFIEGEGYKLITEQGATGLYRKRIIYYTVDYLLELFDHLDYLILDAQRQVNMDQSLINLTIKRKSSL